LHLAHTAIVLIVLPRHLHRIIATLRTSVRHPSCINTLPSPVPSSKGHITALRFPLGLH